LYSLQIGLSNEVSLDIPLRLKKKVGGGCALPGADMQKPHASKCGQGKIKIDLNFIAVKVSTLYMYKSKLKERKSKTTLNVFISILRPTRDWEILNCRLVTQHYKMH
jgi:hypothetical protein